MITLNKSKNENPMKSPSDPPTAATMAVKSKRRTSSMMVTSVDKYPSHMEVNSCLDSSSSSSKEKLSQGSQTRGPPGAFVRPANIPKNDKNINFDEI